MTAEPFVDTNVLVYAYDSADPAKQRTARELLATVRAVVSAQVLGEFYWTVTRKLASPVSPEAAREAVAELAQLRVIPLTGALVRDAIKTSQEHQLSYWDALILEAAAGAGCRELLTEDLNAGATLRGVHIRNPFA